MEKLYHFRHILFFKFRREAKAAEEARNICSVYGDNATGESMARKWFCFKEGRLTLFIFHVKLLLRGLMKFV